MTEERKKDWPRCQKCGELMDFHGNYRVTSITLLPNGIPQNLYVHRSCETPESEAQDERRPA